MKKFLLGLALLYLALGPAMAQKDKPSELVRSKKNEGSSFESVRLFKNQQNQRLDNRIPQELKEHTLFRLDFKEAALLRSSAPETMTFEVPGPTPISLELVKTNLYADGFSIEEMPSGKMIVPENRVVHYRGIVQGEPRSIAALSIMDDEVTGMISIREQDNNLVIGKLKNSDQHIMYKDTDIGHLDKFVCGVLDNDEAYSPTKLSEQSRGSGRQAAKCPKIFFDIGHDIVRDKGGSRAASRFIESIFNQVAVIYANESVTIKLSGMTAWTSSTPFTGLDGYRSYRNRNSFNGDLGHFVTYDYPGGLAWVNALCTSRNYGVSGIRDFFHNVPTYSRSVKLIAHELGHNLGSKHTHACVWNGNGTAIDGCGEPTDGNCRRPGLPSGGGTIMSYCNLTSVGVDLAKGFGRQPGNIIRNSIRAARCVVSCNSSGGGGSGICAGVSPWEEGRRYDVGDRVVNRGHLFERTREGWDDLGKCNGNDPCANIPAWSADRRYAIGDKVINRAYLFEWTGSEWKQLAQCGTSAEPTLGMPGHSTMADEQGFVVFPNPATGVDELTVEGSIPFSATSRVLLMDMSGKVLKSMSLLQSPHGELQRTVPVNGLKRGAYFIQVIGIHRTFTEKVILQ